MDSVSVSNYGLMVEANKKHRDHPMVGDGWHEHFCYSFFIVDINEANKTMLVCSEKAYAKDHYSFQPAKLQRMTFQEFRDRVSYKDQPLDHNPTMLDVSPEIFLNDAKTIQKALIKEPKLFTVTDYIRPSKKMQIDSWWDMDKPTLLKMETFPCWIDMGMEHPAVGWWIKKEGWFIANRGTVFPEQVKRVMMIRQPKL